MSGPGSLVVKFPHSNSHLAKSRSFEGTVEPVNQDSESSRIRTWSCILTRFPQFTLCQNAQELRKGWLVALFMHFKIWTLHFVWAVSRRCKKVHTTRASTYNLVETPAYIASSPSLVKNHAVYAPDSISWGRAHPIPQSSINGFFAVSKTTSMVKFDLGFEISQRNKSQTNGAANTD